MLSKKYGETICGILAAQNGSPSAQDNRNNCRMLIPQTCREHVLGDLSERYTSLHRYMMEALDTIPLVVLSQLRLHSGY